MWCRWEMEIDSLNWMDICRTEFKMREQRKIRCMIRHTPLIAILAKRMLELQASELAGDASGTSKTGNRSWRIPHRNRRATAK